MATKTTGPVNLIDSFAEFKENKNIDRATLMSVLEECFRSVIAKTYGSDENYDVIVNPDKGDFEIYRNRTVANVTRHINAPYPRSPIQNPKKRTKPFFFTIIYSSS